MIVTYEDVVYRSGIEAEIEDYSDACDGCVGMGEIDVQACCAQCYDPQFGIWEACSNCAGYGLSLEAGGAVIARSISNYYRPEGIP